MDGWLAGGATVPGLALIAVLPLVRQVFEVPLSWQSGRAAATGAHVPATTIRPATSAADFAGAVIVHFPSGATALVVPIVSVHTPPLREALSLPQTNNQSDEQLIRPPNRQRRRPGIPSHGIIGILAGGATVPGLALIDTLPLV